MEESINNFEERIRAFFPGKPQDIRTYSPLTLAYIGDAIYDLVIRTVVVERANRPNGDLHHITVKYVNAGAQARMIEALQGRLTEEEQSVYRRGKNSKPHTMAKNAAPADYKKATGFEAVMGYLYLKGETERMLELIRDGIAAAGMKI
ncbi:MAG: Mini-ribonuclease 3 [Acetatifactor sp.]